MLLQIFHDFDNKILILNKELAEDGISEIPRFFVKILGQMALVEAKLGIDLFATVDVDAYANFNNLAKRTFCEVLLKRGLTYDELSNEIWMPEETQYRHAFRGLCFDGFFAEPEYVLLSKVLKAPAKNQIVLAEYLAHQPSSLFLQLCVQYKVNLKELLKNV